MANEILYQCSNCGKAEQTRAAPTADMVKVVLCKDCKYFKPYQKPVEDFEGFCTQHEHGTDEIEFCSYPVNERRYEEYFGEKIDEKELEEPHA